MEGLLVIGIIIAFIIWKDKNKKAENNKLIQQKEQNENQPQEETPKTEIEEGKNYRTGYQQKWLLTYNEKAAFKIIKEIAETKGYTVFAKVRMLDLVEPKSINKRDKSYLWKIQAKHVDFVICNEKLIAKWIIEIQDNSHKTTERTERDTLVKDILNACDYKVLMTYGPTKEEISNFLSNES